MFNDTLILILKMPNPRIASKTQFKKNYDQRRDNVVRDNAL